jgi:hypothetical protein
MKRFDSIENLTSSESLCELVGPISKIEKKLLSGVGYSDSALVRIKLVLQSGISRDFVLKHTRLTRDWLSQRARDQVGRESALLNDPSLPLHRVCV